MAPSIVQIRARTSTSSLETVGWEQGTAEAQRGERVRGGREGGKKTTRLPWKGCPSPGLLPTTAPEFTQGERSVVQEAQELSPLPLLPPCSPEVRTTLHPHLVFFTARTGACDAPVAVCSFSSECQLQGTMGCVRFSAVSEDLPGVLLKKEAGSEWSCSLSKATELAGGGAEM